MPKRFYIGFDPPFGGILVGNLKYSLSKSSLLLTGFLPLCLRSSGVERFLGKEKVASANLAGGFAFLWRGFASKGIVKGSFAMS